MRVGVGLPSTVPGARADLLREWAVRADAGPFAILAVLDRIVYDSYDPLIALAAVAPLTSRIRLATNVLIGPLRSAAQLAKSAASLHALSGGRLTLGLAIGARTEDYAATEVEHSTRGKRLVEQLAALRDLWEDARLCPQPSGQPELLVGGTTDAVFARVARYADGYVHGGGPPRAFARAADKARAAWLDLGRPGLPALWGQGYFALGDDTTIEAGRSYMRDYYAFTGHFAERIVEGLLTTPQAVAQFLRGYADAGCDELVLFPTVPDLAQLDRLADLLPGLNSVTFHHIPAQSASPAHGRVLPAREGGLSGGTLLGAASASASAAGPQEKGPDDQ
jgi:alkanesulfonate monooxygenase SsuD/methylene tetrahydromethanopterin reductase-like flavin-dependent oxidoreductase (luciferase family)